MKKIILIAVFAIAFTVFADFSDNCNRGRKKWGDWMPAGSVGKFLHSTVEGNLAPGALEINVGPDNPLKNTLCFLNHFTAQPGKTYFATVFVKAVDLDDKAVVTMGFQGKDKKQQFLGTESLSVKLSAEELADGKWHQLNYELKVPSTGKWENTAQVLCTLSVGNTDFGQVFFDDFSFTEKAE